MSKKNKKLKKKKLSASAENYATAAISISDEVLESQPAETSSIASNDKNSAPAAIPDSEEFQYVRKDVKKILMLLTVIIILLFGLYYMDLKTSFISSFGDWIFKVLNIQTQ